MVRPSIVLASRKYTHSIVTYASTIHTLFLYLHKKTPQDGEGNRLLNFVVSHCKQTLLNVACYELFSKNSPANSYMRRVSGCFAPSLHVAENRLKFFKLGCSVDELTFVRSQGFSKVETDRVLTHSTKPIARRLSGPWTLLSPQDSQG